jgi:hypothetical protein
MHSAASWLRISSSWAINRATALHPIPPSGRPTMLDYWLRSELANKAGSAQ